MSDAGFGEFRRQVTYKTGWHGSRLVVADRWYPSSRTCSECRTVKAKLSLSERIFTCDACGLVIDRDLNAARNLARLGLAENGTVAASGAETLNARGGKGSGRTAVRRTTVKPAPANREAGTATLADRTGTAAGQPAAA